MKEVAFTMLRPRAKPFLLLFVCSFVIDDATFLFPFHPLWDRLGHLLFLLSVFLRPERSLLRLIDSSW